MLPVWRYLTLAKLISLLSEGAFYFSRADLLGDPHEGTISAQNAANIRTQFCDPGRPNLIVKVRRMWKLFTYVSCLHLNETESEAMWRVYCPTNEGVALKTTYGKLAQSVQSNDFCLGSFVTLTTDRSSCHSIMPLTPSCTSGRPLSMNEKSELSCSDRVTSNQ